MEKIERIEKALVACSNTSQELYDAFKQIQKDKEFNGLFLNAFGDKTIPNYTERLQDLLQLVALENEYYEITKSMSPEAKKKYFSTVLNNMKSEVEKVKKEEKNPNAKKTTNS